MIELEELYPDDVLRRIDRRLDAAANAGPPRRASAVAGVALTAAMLRGVTDVIEDDDERDRGVDVEPAWTATPVAVELFLVWHDPRQSRAVVRPWLL